MDYSSIAKRIKDQRKKEGLTLQELADKIGLTKSTLQRYETGGIKNIPLVKIKPLSIALNCSPEFIMGWDTIATPKQIRFLESRGFQRVSIWPAETATEMVSIISENGWEVPSWICPETYDPREKINQSGSFGSPAKQSQPKT